jgi:hypothetical protein
MAVDWRAVAVVSAFCLYLSFGIKVFRALPPETPVVYACLNANGGYAAGCYYATIDCIHDGHSLEGYFADRSEAVLPVNPFSLLDGVPAQIITLARARRLVHDAPKKRDADPLCVQANGFQSQQRALLLTLFD